jgi:ubiquinone/menaquinone biosynthesis C-methylase UbiE
MNVKEAYNLWAGQYDTDENKTRDLEGISLRTTLSTIEFSSCLEIGCGTGKNTEWLVTKANQITAVDLSDEMLRIAKAKINSEKVKFVQADIISEWDFIDQPFDPITCSLVLEHVENLNEIFRKISDATKKNGFVYIGELHPFKQYGGSKARFETGEGSKIVTCFNHHVSDFTQAAIQSGFEILNLWEYFDDVERQTIPRILTILLKHL